MNNILYLLKRELIILINNYAVKTGWIYEDGNWYYLNKLGNFGDDSYNPLPIGEVAKGWTQDFHVTLALIEANLLRGIT